MDEILELLHDISDCLDDYSDVNDGDDGQPVANRAMRLQQRVDELIARLEKP